MARALVTEHVASRLGRRFSCPIPEPVLVDVPSDLIARQAEMAHMQPGLGHAVEYLPGCGDKEVIGPPRNAQNVSAYAPLALLYGWFSASDQQVIIESATQHVYSVDHGLFLPNQENWTVASLQTAPDPTPEQQFAQHCTPEQLRAAATALGQVSDDDIADDLATVPSQWALDDSDLIALGEYLCQRRDKLVSSLT